jgi:hypothetical protein
MESAQLEFRREQAVIMLMLVPIVALSDFALLLLMYFQTFLALFGVWLTLLCWKSARLHMWEDCAQVHACSQIGATLVTHRCIHTCLHAYIYMHTHTHTYIYTSIHVHAGALCSGRPTRGFKLSRIRTVMYGCLGACLCPS